MNYGSGFDMVSDICGGPCGFEFVCIFCVRDGGAGAMVGVGIGAVGHWNGTDDSLVMTPSVSVLDGDNN